MVRTREAVTHDGADGWSRFDQQVLGGRRAVQGSWGRQLWILGVLGTVLILGLSAAAIITIESAVHAGEELVQLSRAQRLHQDADMMHDALRADVTSARQAAREGTDEAEVRRETEAHVRRFQADIDELRRLDLPPDVDAALASLPPAQERFLAETEHVVDTELAGRPSSTELENFRTGFDALTTAQQQVTRRLAESSLELEATQQRQQTVAVRVLVAATAVALAAWAALVLMHRQAGRRLNEALRREAEQRATAELLQRSLLPAPLPQVPGVRLAARSLTGDTTASVGGDWYDVFPLPSGELGLVVGDVVGHDLQAATAMGQLRAAVRAFAVHEESPAAVLQRVNTVAGLLDVTDMTTCLYAVVTPTNGHVRWSSAGHPNPFVLPADGGPGHVLAGDPGPPLGASVDGGFVDCDFVIAEGAFFMLYTDGLVERRSMTLSDGQTRLETIRGPHDDPDLLCERVLTDMLADDVQTDDVTLLALQA